MSFSDLLEGFLEKALIKLLPAIINIILKWLESLGEKETEEVVEKVVVAVGTAVKSEKVVAAVKKVMTDYTTA